MLSRRSFLGLSSLAVGVIFAGPACAENWPDDIAAGIDLDIDIDIDIDNFAMDDAGRGRSARSDVDVLAVID